MSTSPGSALTVKALQMAWELRGKPTGVLLHSVKDSHYTSRKYITLNALGLAASRVNFNASMIGGMKETQEVVNYCSENKILPTIQIIKAEQINEAWDNVFNKKARYRYVIDASTM